MSIACTAQAGTGKSAPRIWKCARERPWTWAAARGASAHHLLANAPNLQPLCRAVADENMAVSIQDPQSLQVDNGKVLGHQDGVALVDGLSDCAPIGALVLFSDGSKGAVLWWHSVGRCTVLVTEHGQQGEDGLLRATARCVLKDDPMELPEALKDRNAASKDEAPALSALFTRLSVPAGAVGPGQVVDHICRPLGAQQNASMTAEASDSMVENELVPLLNEQVSMESRGVISEPLFTGIPAVDVLTPLAHGCALLTAGADPVATTDLLLRITSQVSGAKATPLQDSQPSETDAQLRVVYVAAGCPQDEVDRRVEWLRASGALPHCTVVTVPDTAPLSQQYAALCAGVAIGERARDQGGKAIVLLDSAECMVEVWKAAVSLALGGAPQQDAGDMVEVNGMLVSAAAAERRRFLSALLQRAAKRLSGGTLSLLLALRGVPASGERGAAARGRTPPPLDQYKHLSEELKAKMAKALAAKAKAEQDSAPALETVEEIMSISDGQLVLKGKPPSEGDAAAAPTLQLDVVSSLSRMGTRAYPLALKDLAPKVRFELTQAVDAARFSPTTTDAVQQSCMARCRLLEAALVSPPERALSVGETASLVWLLLNGHLDNVPSERLWERWSQVWAAVEEEAPEAVDEMASTQQLTEASKTQVQRVCAQVLQELDQ